MTRVVDGLHAVAGLPETEASSATVNVILGQRVESVLTSARREGSRVTCAQHTHTQRWREREKEILHDTQSGYVTNVCPYGV